MKRWIMVVLGMLSMIESGNTSESYCVYEIVRFVNDEDHIHYASHHDITTGISSDIPIVNWNENLTNLLNKVQDEEYREQIYSLLNTVVVKNPVVNYGKRNDDYPQWDTEYILPQLIYIMEVDDEALAINKYNDPASKRSLHWLIRPDGMIIECVPISKRAYGGFDINKCDEVFRSNVKQFYLTEEGSPADVCGIYIGLIRGDEFEKQKKVCLNLIQILQNIYEIPDNYIFIPSKYIDKTLNPNIYASYSNNLNDLENKDSASNNLNDLRLQSMEENEDADSYSSFDSSASTEIVTPDDDTEDFSYTKDFPYTVGIPKDV